MNLFFFIFFLFQSYRNTTKYAKDHVQRYDEGFKKYIYIYFSCSTDLTDPVFAQREKILK